MSKTIEEAEPGDVFYIKELKYAIVKYFDAFSNNKEKWLYLHDFTASSLITATFKELIGEKIYLGNLRDIHNEIFKERGMDRDS